MRQKGSKGIILGTKVCIVCDKEFEYKLKSKKYCSNACKCKQYWPKTKQKINPFKRLYYSILTRDPKTNVTYEYLEKLYKEQEGLCAITGFPLLFIKNKGSGLKKDTLQNCSVDRIDQTIGYTPDNVRLVCYQANMMRSVLSDEELIIWCDAIKTNLKKEALRKQRAAGKKGK